MSIDTRARAQKIKERLKPTYLLTFIIFSLFSVVLSGVPDRAEAQSFRFSSIVVEGNQRIADSTIVTYAGIAPGETIGAGDLNAAYQRILASGLFETAELTPRGGRLVIEVVEYPTINLVNFEGNKRLKDDALVQIVESQSRRVLKPGVAERDAQRIAEAYEQQGRLAARVTPKIIRRSDNRADLVFEIFEGGVVEIERIGFVGNRQYSDRRLRRVLETKQAGLLRAFIKKDAFVEDRIEFDKQVLSDFYQSRGYVDFRITNVDAELFRERDGYAVTFNVEEGQQFRFGKITTISEINGADEAEFQDALKIRAGVIYTPTLVENSISRMEKLALRKGLDFVRVDPRITRNERDLTLDVEFALVKGERIFVERIDIEGNTTTLDRVIRQQFRAIEGDPFNPREIREAAERIRALGYFADAQVNAREGTNPDQVVVEVDVEEQSTGSLTFGGTFSTDSGVGLVVQFSERNFLGRGQTLNLSLSSASDITDYGVNFVEPHLLGRDVALGLNFALRENTFSELRFDSTVGSFTPSLAFPLGEASRLQLSYSVKNTDYELESNGSAVAGSLTDLEIARGDIWSSSVAYQYTYDSRKTGLNPNSGYVLTFGQEFGGVGGDYTFVKTTGRVSAQTTVLNEEVTLRATFEGGALHSPDNDSRFTDRFSVTSSTFRGFDVYGIGPRERAADGSFDDPLGGNFFAVARFEAEFPLGLPEEYGITGGVFYDIGSVWGLDNSSANVLYEDFSLRQTIGLSLFWTTPVGPLRFNFSKAIQKEEFDEEQQFNLTIRTDF